MKIPITRESIVLVAVLAASLAILRPFLPPYYAFLVCLCMIWALAALGFNLLLGYTGLLSFGHAVFFGIGAYTPALIMKYTSILSFETLLLSAIIVTALIAAGLGVICVRLTDAYFTMIMLGFGEIFYVIVVKFYGITGGNDGLSVSLPTVLGSAFNLGRFDFVTSYYYYIVLSIFVICILILLIIINSPFGKTIQAIRENPTRVRFIGISPYKYRFGAFVMSAIFVGIAGVLYSFTKGIVTPEIFPFTASAKIVIITLLGGFMTFVGPIVGAFVFTILDVFVRGYIPYWEFFLGALIITLVIILPRGIAGELKLGVRKLREKIYS